MATHQIRVNCQNCHKVSKPGSDTPLSKLSPPYRGTVDSDISLTPRNCQKVLAAAGIQSFWPTLILSTERLFAEWMDYLPGIEHSNARRVRPMLLEACHASNRAINRVASKKQIPITV